MLPLLGITVSSPASANPLAEEQTQTTKGKNGKQEKTKKTKKAGNAKKTKDTKKAKGTEPQPEPAAQEPEVLAPDEDPFATDINAGPAPETLEHIEPGGKGARVSWKQHPSFRVGSV